MPPSVPPRHTNRRVRKAARLSLFVLLAVLPAALDAQAPAGADTRIDRIFARWDSERTPGCAVAAEQDSRAVVSRAYGMAELEHGVANAPGTVFEAGSVAKQFTAAAIMLLVLEGRLSLDDEVRTHVPELPAYPTPVTVRHLVHHTSGLRDWGSVAAIAGWGRGERVHSHAHVLDILARQSALNYPAGAAYSYTNSGYNLMAVIVERVSGVPFAEFSRQRIFEPLGLRDTQWRDDFRRIVPRRSTAYAARGDGFVTDRPNEHVHGNGGLLTTVADLLRWDRALESGEGLGGAAFVRLMHERGVLTDGTVIAYAGGVQIGSRRGAPEVSHTGATGGYRAFLGRYPEQRLRVAVLCNVGAVDPGGVGRQVADLFLDGPFPAPGAEPARSAARPVRLPAAALRAREGVYRDAATGAPMRLVVEDGALRIQGGARLVPVSRDVFRVGDGGRELVFEPARGGRPRVRLLEPGSADGSRQEAAFEPVDAFEPTASELAAYAGRFHSDDAETTFEARVDEGRLVLHRRPDARIVLVPAYRDVFRGAELGLVRFERDAAGRVTGFVLRQARVHGLEFRRM
jgi:CubicO group peptidase (beta-lactamase class C family)